MLDDKAEKRRLAGIKRARERADNNQQIKWLREHLNLTDWGYLYLDVDGNKAMRRANTNDVIKSACSGAQTRLNAMCYSHIAEHLAGIRNAFYASRRYYKRTKISSARWGEYIFALVDIDVLKALLKGTKAGGIAFAEYLKATFFADMHIETSTNGNGTHGYIRIHVGNLSNEAVNQKLQELQVYLSAVARSINADIEMVEIKGRCSVATWENRKMIGYKAGQLAKLPRSITALPRTAFTIDQLDAIMSRPLPAGIPNCTGQLDKPENFKISAVSTVKKSKGSAGGAYLSGDVLEGCAAGGRFYAFACTLLANQSMKIGGRRLVTVDDVAIFAMLLEFFSGKMMNDDGSMPFDRFVKWWTMLETEGSVPRPMNRERITAIRNLFSDKGLIEWESREFEPPMMIHGAVVQKGKAMKWAGNVVFLNSVKVQEKKKTSLVHTDCSVIRPQMTLDFVAFGEKLQEITDKQIAEYEKQQQILESMLC